MNSEEQKKDEHSHLMGELKVRIGKVEFSGKGEQKWLAEQLRSVVSAIPLAAVSSSDEKNSKTDDVQKPEVNMNVPKFSASLASHIKSKGAEGNQTLRFLVTADWLRLREGGTLTTASVSKALTDNHQSRLGNPADCLNKNVAKGFCEKVKEGFYITPEGLSQIGYS